MSLLTGLTKIAPNLIVAAADINKMFGSTSKLQVHLDGANLNWQNFKPDAGIGLHHKADALGRLSYLAIPFNYATVAAPVAGQFATSDDVALDLVIWEPPRGMVYAAIDSLRIDKFLCEANPTGGLALKLYKQSQRTALVEFGSMDLVALYDDATPGPEYPALGVIGPAMTITTPAGEFATILPEKGERVIVRLVFNLLATVKLANLIGTLYLKVSHTRRSD